jgi:tetratricopeptide (TPR) repeat protein
MARRLGDPQALLVALHARHWATLAPDLHSVRLANAAEMLDVAMRVGDEEAAFLARHARLHCLLERCDIAGVDAELEAMARLADRTRQPFHRWRTANARAMRALLEGRLEEAERLARGALEIGGLRQSEYVTYLFEHALLIAIRWMQGRLGELREAIRFHGEWYSSLARWRNALVAVELADERAARAEVERHALRDFADLPRDGLWLLHLCSLAEACVPLGDERRAARLYQLLSPYADRNAISMTTMPFGPVALRLGMMAAMLGRWEEAERHFQLAMERCTQLGAPAITARVLYEHARMLVARGEEADLPSAAKLLARAEGICRQLAASIDPGRRPAVAEPSTPGAVFRREGDYWTLAYAGQTAHLRDMKGLHYLACLLRRPGREVHVLELVREAEGVPAEPARGLSSDAMLQTGLRRSRLDEADRLFDPQAKAAYRRRLRDLEEELEEARSWGDPERAARAQEEMDALTEELLREAGLGGRNRALPSPAERARVSVTKAIRKAVRTTASQCPALGDHLAASVRTGRYCSYAPPGEAPPAWSL